MIRDMPACAGRIEVERAALPVRVLITIAPLSYRQVLMLTLQRRRPQVEVILSRPEELDGEVERLAPDLVVRNVVTQGVRDRVISWVEMLVHDGPGANVCVSGAPSTLEDAGTEELLAIVDETERLAS